MIERLTLLLQNCLYQFEKLCLFHFAHIRESGSAYFAEKIKKSGFLFWKLNFKATYFNRKGQSICFRGAAWTQVLLLQILISLNTGIDDTVSIIICPWSSMATHKSQAKQQKYLHSFICLEKHKDKTFCLHNWVYLK